MEYSKLYSSIEKLKEETTPKWGRMNSSMMLKHCSAFIDVYLNKTRLNPIIFTVGFVFGIFHRLYLKYIVRYNVKNYIKNSNKLEMIYLPPYSPNLNLIERVWKFMKTKVIRNQHYDTFLDFKKALGDFFQKFPDYILELDNLLVEEFQTFPVK